MSQFSPFKLVEISQGNFSLLLTDFDQQAPVFAEYGYDAGGYAWSGVAEALVKGYMLPDLAKVIQFDPESSMFCAYSRNLEALEKLAELLFKASQESEILRQAIEAADPEGMD